MAYELVWSEQADADFGEFDIATKRKIKSRLEFLRANYDTIKDSKNITPLIGAKGKFRFKINDKLRAIFEVDGAVLKILLLRIKWRKDAYEDI